MAEPVDFVARVNHLWDRVQTNEESDAEKRDILNLCDELLMDSKFVQNAFLTTKVKLIMHKAGKVTDLAALTLAFEEEALKDPQNCDIWICVAECRLHQDNPDEALVSLEYAKDNLPPNPAVLCLMSLCLRRKKQKDLQGSLNLAKEAVKIGMQNGKSWACLGIAYLSLSGLENILQSKKAFLCALKYGEDKNGDVLLNFGTVNELLLDFKGALKAYEDSMRVTNGWIVAQGNVARMQELLKKATSRAVEIGKMRPKKKGELVGRLATADEYIVVETPTNPDLPGQIALCLSQKSEVVAFGMTKTMRTYLRPEKTVLKLSVGEFDNLEMDGVQVPYHAIGEMNQVQITAGATPADVPPVSVTSSIA
jgi:tetratricopeptide (TPR) repeat protein